jgi:tetrapyrrole methylase family protein/MazG family protein
MEKKESIGRRFERLVEILSVLRSEHGCPWDREQDERTIVNYFLEEVFEATDAAMADDSRCLEEELGDVLMEVVFLAQIYQEKGRFTIATVLDGIIQKMVRRSVFEGMSRSAPALLQAFQVGQRAASLGFDWNEARDVLDKVKEEVGELESAIQAGEDKSIGEEIGDLMFSLACLSRLAGHNPELALRAATRKFQRRFRAMEKVLKSRGRKFSGMELEEMDQVWEMVKKNPL